MEFGPPLFRNFDGILVLAFLLSRHAQICSVLDKSGHIVAVHCVKHVPEVLSVWKSTFWSVIGHVDHEVFDVPREWPELFYREFLILGYVYVFYFGQWQEFLLFDKHQLNEVFVKHLGWWDIQLQLLLEILNEVFFAAKAHE